MKSVDVFAGCGGLSSGLRRVGFDPVFAIEIDQHAAATYRTNFGDHVFEGDIVALGDAEIPIADVVVGGPPCQGFSQLGARESSDLRNLLWHEYARVVAIAEPSVFVLENVPQFLNSDQWSFMVDATSPGGSLAGYQMAAGVLNAADFGVPQRRRRAIVIGSRVGVPSLPIPTHGREGLRPWNTVREALGGIPFQTGDSNLPSRILESGVPGPFSAAEMHLSRNPQPVSLLRYDAVPPGGNRFDLPDELLPPCWANKPTGTTDVMGRLEWDKPSLTIRTEFFKPEKGRSLHPEYHTSDTSRRVNRSISHWEAARLQTFEDDFTWCGTKQSIARQIGNAVPPRLAQAIGLHVQNHLLNQPPNRASVALPVSGEQQELLPQAVLAASSARS